MMNEFQQTLNRVNNFQQTENGATGYSTSGQNLVDLNFVVPARHKNVSPVELEKFVQALNEDTVLAVKWLFYLRDVREGLGERDSFIKLFKTLWLADPVSAGKVVKLIPEYGRWKDVIDILAEFPNDNDLTETIYLLIENQLREDCVNLTEDKSVSLLAKWLPSINASGKSRKLAKRICNKLGLTFENYRKVLSSLRKYLDVTEVKTCGGKWNEIDYNKVSSNANARYLNSFMRHDPERRQRYLDALSSPVSSGAVMHASNLYPHEVYAKYSEAHRGYYGVEVNEDQGIEALWANLKNIDTVGNTMVVVDNSGSMITNIKGSKIMAIDVARSLGVFFSERCIGEFKDKVIEFSARPRYIDLTDCKSLADKYNTLTKYDDCSNTNLEKVFDLLLKTAIDCNLPQSELPQRILIVSDMEFDGATNIYGSHNEVMAKYQTLFESIKTKWSKYGYTMPNIVFWNVNSRTNTIPVTANECGVTLVSGYSVNNVKMVLSGDVNPWTALKSVLESDRYNAIDTALAE